MALLYGFFLVVRMLREVYRFNGYIHMKSIPGADPLLVEEAGLLADRLSVNVEIPTDSQLRRLAPEKNHRQMRSCMPQRYWKYLPEKGGR